MEASHLVFFVNGNKITETNPNPETTLLQYLRRKLYLTGTKEACGQGACGACTVMVSSYCPRDREIRHISVNSCLIPICTLHGKAVTTVEGVGSTKKGLHIIQKSLIESHGMQCGFCTPGMVMTMFALLRNNPHVTQSDIERSLEGILCRCTGYRPILDAFVGFSTGCHCGKTGTSCCRERVEEANDSSQHEKMPLLKTEEQDFIFPSELQLNAIYYKTDLIFKSPTCTWHRPSSFEKLVTLMTSFPDALVTFGCNSTGYSIRQGIYPGVIIHGESVEELQTIALHGDELVIGAGVTMATLEKFLQKLSKDIGDPKNRSCVAALDVLRWIAVDQIRNTATIGGHIMSGASNHDLHTYLLALDARLRFVSSDLTTSSCKLQDLFQQDLKLPKPFLLHSVSFNLTQETEFCMGIKQPNRRGFDYGIITCGLFAKVVPAGQGRVEVLRIGLGGVAKRPILIELTNELSQCPWDDKLVGRIHDVLRNELRSFGGTDDSFQNKLVYSFVSKFYENVSKKLGNDDSMVTQTLGNQTVQSTRIFDIPSEDGGGIVWKPIPNTTGSSMATGEALYIDDIPPFRSELFAACVTSTKAHAKISHVDASAALALDGVHGYVDYNDIPTKKNQFGPMTPDMELFAEKEVMYHGQVLGVIVADTREVARKACKLVRVSYEDLEPILTIEEAVEKGSFHTTETSSINFGDVDKALESADKVIEGHCQTGLQEHMYLEPQSSIVVPLKEQQEFDVFVSTQNQMEVQLQVANFLGLSRNRINVRTKRVGGAFGGKVIDCISPASLAAVAAYKYDRPIRCVFDRITDVRATGKRHPVYAIYKVACTNDGKVTAADIQIFLDAGYATDPSQFVAKMGIFYIQGAYNIPNIRTRTRLCKTNLPSNTAFRGFGAPQHIFIAECILERVAMELQRPSQQIRQLNLLRKGETTWFGRVLEDDNLYKCWQECQEISCWNERKNEIEEFNRKNDKIKKGIAMTCVMTPLGYIILCMNQANAVVTVYLDGSVLLKYGGIEMGQGIHTKMIQVASTVLGISRDKIIIGETSTSAIPNATESGGSFTADLASGAVKNACEILKERLEPLVQKNPNKKWEDYIEEAYENRISLTASGHYKIVNESFDFEKQAGDFCLYFTYGVACTEVEVDVSSGEHVVNKVHIVMDVGKSLNPAVDIGQIEGAFLQGYGMMTMESLYPRGDGSLSAGGPLGYKIPTVRNIPREMHVKLLQSSDQVRTVYSSKGTGEPPLVLGISVYMALQQAVMATHSSNPGNFYLPCPATVQRIRMACWDK